MTILEKHDYKRSNSVEKPLAKSKDSMDRKFQQFQRHFDKKIPAILKTFSLKKNRLESTHCSGVDTYCLALSSPVLNSDLLCPAQSSTNTILSPTVLSSTVSSSNILSYKVILCYLAMPSFI